MVRDYHVVCCAVYVRVSVCVNVRISIYMHCIYIVNEERCLVNHSRLDRFTR